MKIDFKYIRNDSCCEYMKLNQTYSDFTAHQASDNACSIGGAE